MKEGFREIIARMKAKAPDKTPDTPSFRPLPKPAPVPAQKPAGMDRSRKLTEGERGFYKRKFGTWPPDGMTLGEFRAKIRESRKRGGFD